MLLRYLFCLMVLYPVYGFSQLKFESVADFAILEDFETGTILYSKNADERMYPASMTKILTSYLIFDGLKNGQLSLMDNFSVSRNAYSIGGSRMFLEQGAKVPLEQLIRGIIVQSGNDASVTVAENMAGTELAFAEIMNDTARRLGMSNSNFVNASGWPEDDHYTTARDLLILARATIRDFPDYYRYYAETSFSYGGIRQSNRNNLLYRGIGADGLKTGYTEASGYGLTASAAVGDRRLLLVINGLDNNAQRTDEAERLMEWGFRNFANFRLLYGGDKIGEARVHNGHARQVALVVKEDIVLTLPKHRRRDLSVVLVYDSPLPAPLTAGDTVARLEVMLGDERLGEYAVYAGENVSEISIFGKLARKLGIDG